MWCTQKPSTTDHLPKRTETCPLSARFSFLSPMLATHKYMYLKMYFMLLVQRANRRNADIKKTVKYIKINEPFT